MTRLRGRTLAAVMLVGFFPGCAPVPTPDAAPPSASPPPAPQPCGTPSAGHYRATVTIAEDATADHGKDASGAAIVDHFHTDGSGAADFTVTSAGGLGGSIALQWIRTVRQTVGQLDQPFAAASLAAAVSGGAVLGSPDGFTVSATVTFSSGTGDWASALSGYVEPIQLIFDRLAPVAVCKLRAVGHAPGSMLSTSATQKLVLTAEPAN